MEAVAAASSVAGLVSLDGQALDGIVKLRRFFIDCAPGLKTVDLFLRRSQWSDPKFWKI